MKVRIAYTVDVDDVIRREINDYYGREGLADREEIKRWYETFGGSEDDNLAWSAQLKEEGI